MMKLFFLYFFVLISQACLSQVEKSKKKDLLIECEYLTPKNKFCRLIIISESNVQISDLDSNGIEQRNFKNGKWTLANSKMEETSALDYIFDCFYSKTYDSINFNKLGRAYSLKKLNGDLYRVSFNLNGTYYAGEIQCINNLVIASRLTKYNKIEDMFIVIEHESVIVKKIKKKRKER